MNQQERAQQIIAELMAMPKDIWQRAEEGGQAFFVASGHSGQAMYFSEALMDFESDAPDSDDAIECYEERLGDAPYAVEIWDETKCVCLLRFDKVLDVEIVEYEHGSWQVVSFSLPAKNRSHQPTAH